MMNKHAYYPYFVVSEASSKLEESKNEATTLYSFSKKDSDHDFNSTLVGDDKFRLSGIKQPFTPSQLEVIEENDGGN